MTPPRANTFASNGTSGRALPMNAPLVVSAISVAVIVVIAFSALATSLAAAFGIGAADGDPGEAVKRLVAKSQEKNQTYQDRFNGRSVFYKPPAWPPAPHREEIVEKPPIFEAPRDTKPVINPIYTGPGIWYAIGDVIRFRAKSASEKPIDIRVGEEKNGIRVISTNLPWTVRVGYMGGEYDVNIWERKPDGFLLAQAPAIEVVPGLIEVPPPRPVVDVPKATGEPTVETPTATAAPTDDATAQPGARTSRRDAARASRGASTPQGRTQGRPQAQPARESRPARGASAPDPAPEDPDEAEEAEADEADADEDAEANQADEEADSEVAGEPRHENNNPQNPSENAGDVAPHPNPPAQPPSTGSAP